MKARDQESTRSWIRRKTRYLLRRATQRRKPRQRRYSGTAEPVVQCCVAYNEYGGYCVPLAARHRPAAQKILSGKVYEQETLEYIIAHRGTGDVVHAGTFFGDFLPGLARGSAEGAVTWAFEPNPESYRCATATIAINVLESVRILNAGLGDEPGRLLLNISDRSGRALGGASRFIESGTSREGTSIAARVVRIDDAVPEDRKVAIVQLDVEGFERAALSGALKTIERCRPILILESLPSAEWLSANVGSLGYRSLGRVDGNTVLSSR